MFDACPHLVKMIIIRAGEEIRRAKGLPEERNITKIYEETSALLGISPIMTTSADTPKLPAPHETINPATGKTLIPKQNCPQCGELKMILVGLCGTCSDAEGGKYKTAWACEKCGYKNRSERPMVDWLKELGVEIPQRPLRQEG